MNYIDPSTKQDGCGPLLNPAAPESVAPPLRQQIFEHVRSCGRAARSDIARALSISAGSATTLTSDLIASGYLREVDEPARETGRGRPPVALEVVPEVAHVIGIKLAFEQHSAVLCDFAGNVVSTATVPASGKRRSTAQMLDEITVLIKRVTQDGLHVVGAVGLGLPGIVVKDTGLVRWSSLLQDTNVDLKEAFATRFDMPLSIDNDTNMLTLAELWFGMGRQKTDFAVVTIENGVGMGVVINNRLYRGTHGMGLELGHTKVQLDGALCRCGQRGCLEAYLGDYALRREAATALDQDDTKTNMSEGLLELLFKEAKAGNRAAETIFRRAGHYLSIGLANIVQLFDPPLIILSGRRTRYDYLYAEEVLADMQKLTLSGGRQPCDVKIHFWKDPEWARGAAVPALTLLTDQMVGGLEVAAS